jgi:Ca2+-binding EF-hand superfamily protein
MQVLAKSLSEEEFLDLSELFKTLDRGNSGSITAADLQQSIKWVGSKLADHEVQTLLDAVCAFLLLQV